MPLGIVLLVLTSWCRPPCIGLSALVSRCSPTHNNQPPRHTQQYSSWRQPLGPFGVSPWHMPLGFDLSALVAWHWPHGVSFWASASSWLLPPGVDLPVLVSRHRPLGVALLASPSWCQPPGVGLLALPSRCWPLGAALLALASQTLYFSLWASASGCRPL